MRFRERKIVEIVSVFYLLVFLFIEHEMIESNFPFLKRVQTKV